MSREVDSRLYAPATERNRKPILDVLLRVLPSRANILEIASGTGEHAVFLASRLSEHYWIPSDPDPQLRASISAWRDRSSVSNLHPPLDIDASDPVWKLPQDISLEAIVNINMIHISPFSACLGLMAGASRELPSGGILYLYGPYKREGKHTAPSNLAFDGMLRQQNPEWGVRDLEEVVKAAGDCNLKLLEVIPMPANNLSVIFQRE